MPAITDLPYIPGARDTRFGVITRRGWVWCLGCADKYPDGDWTDAANYADATIAHYLDE